MADYVPLSTDPYSAHQILIRRCRGASKILDVGCSAGTIATALVAQGAVVDGIEYDREAAEEARRVCRAVEVGDVETMPLPFEEEAYDVILLADLIEHLRDPIALLARVRPFLRPTGRLLLSTPNIANWSMRALHLAGRWDYQDRGIMDRTHMRFFTARTIRRTVTDAGYRVTDVDVTCPLPVLRRPRVSAAAHWLALRRPNLLAYQFIVTAASR